MRCWKFSAIPPAFLLGLTVLIAQFLAAENSKLRMWLEKNHFVTGNEPISGQTAVQLGGKLYFISGTHGSGNITKWFACEDIETFSAKLLKRTPISYR
jgi:hypothetical protein